MNPEAFPNSDGAPESLHDRRTRSVKLLIADDHPLVREGIRSSLETQPDLIVVGQACDGYDAVKKSRELSPDIVLMDISMPRLNGLEATRLLKTEVPSAKVLILTVHDNREYIFEIIRSGGWGYVLKDSSPQDLIRAIRTVQNDQQFFSPGIARIIAEGYTNLVNRLEQPRSLELSQRETEVLTLIADGRFTKEIAAHLGVNVRTVQTYRERIMRKLGINSVAGLTRFAIANHIVDPRFPSPSGDQGS